MILWKNTVLVSEWLTNCATLLEPSHAQDSTWSHRAQPWSSSGHLVDPIEEVGKVSESLLREEKDSRPIESLLRAHDAARRQLHTLASLEHWREVVGGGYTISRKGQGWGQGWGRAPMCPGPGAVNRSELLFSSTPPLFFAHLQSTPQTSSWQSVYFLGPWPIREHSVC